jgi:FtsH-binding integral membrane protein
VTGAATLLDSASLAGLGLALVVMFWLASELGYVAHRRFGRSGGKADREANDESQVLATALLLLALLLGFTFSMALTRYDTRRAEVIKEANDIGTAWLRAGLIETPAGVALQDRLAVYADTRIGRDAADGDDDVAAYAAMRQHGVVLRREIWALAAAATAPDRSTAQATALIAAVNAVIDTATTREAAVDARVPPPVIILLIVYAAVSAFLLGYVLAAFGSHHRMAIGVLFVLLAMTIVLIVDLDRPQNGAIRVSQAAMIDLVAELRAVGPGTPR